MFEALKKSELEEFSVKFSDQEEEGGFFLNVDGVSKMSESMEKSSEASCWLLLFIEQNDFCF